MASMASFFALKATQAVEAQDEFKMRDESMQKITANMENDANVETRTFFQTISSALFATTAATTTTTASLSAEAVTAVAPAAFLKPKAAPVEHRH